MISLHDYSKSKENAEDSLPTLLNDLNKLPNDEIEILCFTPQDITIFQVLNYRFQYSSVCFYLCAINIIINLGSEQKKIKEAYWFNKYCI